MNKYKNIIVSARIEKDKYKNGGIEYKGGSSPALAKNLNNSL